MFTPKVTLPQAGDLLFKNKSPLESIGVPFVIIICVLFVGGLVALLKEGFGFFTVWAGVVFLIISFGFVFIVWALILGIKYGFKDETYEGFYFHDKIVFYRISKQVDEYFTEKKSKEQLLKEIIETKDKISKFEKGDSENDANWLEKYKCLSRLTDLEKGVQIADNSRKPHKFELVLKEVKYFMNEKNEIKVVEENQDNENDLNRFYNKLELSKKYKKHKSEVVAFLNQRVTEAKKIDVENIRWV